MFVCERERGGERENKKWKKNFSKKKKIEMKTQQTKIT